MSTGDNFPVCTCGRTVTGGLVCPTHGGMYRNIVPTNDNPMTERTEQAEIEELAILIYMGENLNRRAEDFHENLFVRSIYYQQAKFILSKGYTRTNTERQSGKGSLIPSVNKIHQILCSSWHIANGTDRYERFLVCAEKLRDFLLRFGTVKVPTYLDIYNVVTANIGAPKEDRERLSHAIDQLLTGGELNA